MSRTRPTSCPSLPRTTAPGSTVALMLLLPGGMASHYAREMVVRHTMRASGSFGAEGRAPRRCSPSCLLCDQLRDLDGVQRCALAQVVGAGEQHQALALGDRVVLADTPHEGPVLPGRIQRRGQIGHGDALGR